MLSSRERRNKYCKDRKKFSSFIAAAQQTMQLLPVSYLVAPQVAPGYMLFSEFDFDHFRSKSPLPFPVKPLMGEPTSGEHFR